MQPKQVKVTLNWYIPSIVLPYVGKEVGSLSKFMEQADFTAMMSTRSVTLVHAGKTLRMPIINSTTVFDAGVPEYVVKVRMPVIKMTILGIRISRLVVESNGFMPVEKPSSAQRVLT